MEVVFLKLLNLSITAGWLALVVIAFRLFFKKVPKWVICLLWGLVGLRLIIPFAPESMFSLVPSKETIPETAMVDTYPSIKSGISIIDKAVNPILSGREENADVGISSKKGLGAGADENASENADTDKNEGLNRNAEIKSDTVHMASDTDSNHDVKPEDKPVQPTEKGNLLKRMLPKAAFGWGVGVLLMLGYFFISYFRLYRKVGTATLWKDNVWQSEFAASPFILGLFKPRIYIPYYLGGAELPHVLAHEKAHIARKDHWIKPVAFLILSVYWFHPLLWAAYVLLCRDIELACDEKVVGSWSAEERKAYSFALLKCSTKHSVAAACPLAFGTVDVKERVRRVKAYKKPAFWVMLAAVATCGVVAVCFLTNPAEEESKIRTENKKLAKTLYGYRTNYVGNNSAVGNLIGNLTFPEDVHYQKFSLQTAYKPYEVTVSFTLSEKDRKGYVRRSAEGLTALGENACMLLALIENVDVVTFELIDEEGAWEKLQFSRAWAEDIFGYDLRAESKSEKNLELLLADIKENMAVNEKPFETAWTSEAEEKTVLDALKNSILNNTEEGISEKNQAMVEALLACNTYPGGGSKTLAAGAQELSCCNFKRLKTISEDSGAEDGSRRVTFYGWVLHVNFYLGRNKASMMRTGSRHMPAALTFHVKGKEYTLEEYWEPQTGEVYETDIRKRFPTDIVEEALHGEKYMLSQMQDCYSQAVSQGEREVNDLIGKLFDTISSGYLQYAAVQDYIDAHESEYQELTYYGKYVLDYCKWYFEWYGGFEGEEAVINRSIRAQVCKDMMESLGEEAEEQEELLRSCDTFLNTPLHQETVTEVVNRQVLDWTDKEVARALQAFKAVIENQTEFTFVTQELNGDKEKTKKEKMLLSRFDSGGQEGKEFAIIDLDGDQLPEVVITFGVYDDLYLILSYLDGEVFAYSYTTRCMMMLKVDGTFYGAGSAFDTTYSHITAFTEDGCAEEVLYECHRDWNPETESLQEGAYSVNDELYGEAEWEAFCSYQDNKPDVVRYQFSEENMERMDADETM